MAGKSLTQRLADLQQKKADLDAQIKQIEQEQSRRLRREQQERARIIGMAMLRLIEKGGDWTEDKLIALVSPFVVSGKERRFLGLAPAVEQSLGKKAPKENLAKVTSKTSSSKTVASPTEQSAHSDAIPEDSASSRVTAQGRLPESASEADILSEFNL